MGEYGGRVGEPTEPRGVGGMREMAGRTSFGASRSEVDVPVVFNFFVGQLVRFRALTDWTRSYSGSSTLEIHDIFECVSDLVVLV